MSDAVQVLGPLASMPQTQMVVGWEEGAGGLKMGRAGKMGEVVAGCDQVVEACVCGLGGGEVVAGP